MKFYLAIISNLPFFSRNHSLLHMCYFMAASFFTTFDIISDFILFPFQ